MKIDLPKKEEFEEVNRLARQVHELHVGWRPDIFKSVDYVIEKERYETLIELEKIYVMRDKEKIIGYATIDIKEKNSVGMHYRKILDLDAICIDEAYRGKGLGTEFMNYLIDLGKKEKCTDLYLNVFEDNEDGIKLYEKIGMRVKNISYSMKI